MSQNVVSKPFIRNKIFHEKVTFSHFRESSFREYNSSRR